MLRKLAASRAAGRGNPRRSSTAILKSRLAFFWGRPRCFLPSGARRWCVGTSDCIAEGTITSVRYGIYPIVSACRKQENADYYGCTIMKEASGLSALMKILFLLVVISVFAAAAVAQQSLGDAARANKARKHTSANVIQLDDDTLPRSSTPAASSAPETAKKTDANAKEAETKDSAKPADAPKDKTDELKKQIELQKKEIATLQRELDVAQREARLHASAYYGDAGTMLRDQAKFAEHARKDQEEINTKKQALDAAQQKLDDLQEQARKAGLGVE